MYTTILALLFLLYYFASNAVCQYSPSLIHIPPCYILELVIYFEVQVTIAVFLADVAL